MRRPVLASSILIGVAAALPAGAWAATEAAASGALPWWAWPVLLFSACFLMGMLAVPAGIGGGTLFVPIVGGLFPFHLDFIRATGTLVALAGSLAAGPALLRKGLADLRLSLPLAATASVGSIAGALVGLALPPHLVQIALGSIVLAITVLMLRSRSAEYPKVDAADPLSASLAIGGVLRDAVSGRSVEWRVHRLALGLVVFLFIGFLGGLFGIGAGWANVPAINLMLGVPLRIAAGSSGLVLALSGSSAACVFFERGAVLPLIAAPAVVGMMLGAQIGARLLQTLPASTIRRLVIGIMIFAGLRALLAGTGIWR